MTTLASEPTGGPAPRRPAPGTANGRPSAPARSRATPAMHQASGRLASTATSNTTSGARPSASVTGVPSSDRPAGRVGRARRARTRIPSWSSRRAELAPRAQHPVGRHAPHLPPGDREAPGQDAPPPGRGAPGRRPRSSAPRTPPRPARSRRSTTTRRIRSAPSIGAISSTRATTTSPSPRRRARRPRPRGRGVESARGGDARGVGATTSRARSHGARKAGRAHWSLCLSGGHGPVASELRRGSGCRSR